MISIVKQHKVFSANLVYKEKKITMVVNRPPTLLAKEQIKEIKKNLKKYSVKFNQKDAQR